MRRWSVTIIYLTAAGVMQESSFTVERETAAEAQEACLRLLLRQPGWEIVGTEVVEIDAGSDGNACRRRRPTSHRDHQAHRRQFCRPASAGSSSAHTSG